MEEVKLFGFYDYLVFIIMLFISAVIGIYHAFTGRKNQTTRDYMMGGKKMSVFPTAISSAATVFSATGLLGFPLEVYRYGTQVSLTVLAIPFFMWTATSAYLPIFYELQVNSAYEYLEKRFGKPLRTFASALFCLGSMVFMTVVVYAPSIAISHVTGVDLWTCIISVTAVGTFYTCIGGLKAVVWSDVFQATVMFCAVFAIIVKGCQDEGGIAKVWQNNYEGGRIEFFNFRLDPRIRYTFWGTTIGKYTIYLALFATNPLLVQRYLSVATLRQSKRILLVNIIPICVVVGISCLLGLIAYSKYRYCDPLRSKRIEEHDQLVPLLVMDTIGQFPGFPGLFVAGILSAALSTLSSMQNTMANLVLEDFLKAYLVPDISDLWATRCCKLLVVIYGCVSLAGASVAGELGDGLLQITSTMYGMVQSPLLGLFALGIFLPWVNTKGASTGLFCSIAFNAWIGIGTLIKKPYIPKLAVSVAGCVSNDTLPEPPIRSNDDVFGLYSLSFIWYGSISVGTIFLVGIVVSLITGPNKVSDVDPRLISPIYYRITNFMKMKAKYDSIQQEEEYLSSLLAKNEENSICLKDSPFPQK